MRVCVFAATRTHAHTPDSLASINSNAGPSVVFKGMALPAFGRADSICSSASKGASSQQKAHRHFGLATLAEQTAHAPSPPGDKAPAGPGEFSTDERVAMDDNPPSQGIGSCSTSSQSCDQNNALEQASRRNSRNSSETASADAAAQASSSTLRSSSKELRSDAASAAAAAEAARQQAWDLEDDLWGDQFTGGATVEPKLQSAEEEELNLPGTMEVVGMAAVGGEQEHALLNKM